MTLNISTDMPREIFEIIHDNSDYDLNLYKTCKKLHEFADIYYKTKDVNYDNIQKYFKSHIIVHDLLKVKNMNKTNDNVRQYVFRNVRRLKFDKISNYDMCYSFHNLTHLTFANKFDQSIDGLDKCAKLTYISFGRYFNYAGSINRCIARVNRIDTFNFW